MHDVSLAGRFAIGEVFAASFITKVYSRAAWLSFRSWLARMNFWRGPSALAAGALAAAEAVVVVLAIVPMTSAAGLAAAAGLAIVLTTGLVVALRRGSREPCHCFGSSVEPLSWQHVARNALLLLLAGTSAGCAFAGGPIVPRAEATLAVFVGLAAGLFVIFFTDVVALLRPGAMTPGARGHSEAYR